MQFKQINKKNQEEIENLSIKDEQEGFLESVKQCLLDASKNPEWVCAGIYEQDTPIGFAMYGMISLTTPKNQVWIDRFMIDKNFQGKGYGKKAFQELIHIVKEAYHKDKIYLSVYENNKAAIHMYKSLGFRFNGELDFNGEKVMELSM